MWSNILLKKIFFFPLNHLKSSSRICQKPNNYVRDLIFLTCCYKSQKTMFSFRPTKFWLQRTQRAFQGSHTSKWNYGYSRACSCQNKKIDQDACWEMSYGSKTFTGDSWKYGALTNTSWNGGGLWLPWNSCHAAIGRNDNNGSSVVIVTIIITKVKAVSGHKPLNYVTLMVTAMPLQTCQGGKLEDFQTVEG